MSRRFRLSLETAFFVATMTGIWLWMLAHGFNDTGTLLYGIALIAFGGWMGNKIKGHP